MRGAGKSSRYSTRFDILNGGPVAPPPSPRQAALQSSPYTCDTVTYTPPVAFKSARRTDQGGAKVPLFLVLVLVDGGRATSCLARVSIVCDRRSTVLPPRRLFLASQCLLERRPGVHGARRIRGGWLGGGAQCSVRHRALCLTPRTLRLRPSPQTAAECHGPVKPLVPPRILPSFLVLAGALALGVCGLEYGC